MKRLKVSARALEYPVLVTSLPRSDSFACGQFSGNLRASSSFGLCESSPFVVAVVVVVVVVVNVGSCVGVVSRNTVWSRSDTLTSWLSFVPFY